MAPAASRRVREAAARSVIPGDRPPMDRPFALRRARVPSARGGGKQQVTTWFGGRLGQRRERRVVAHTIARGSLLQPRCRRWAGWRRGGFCLARPFQTRLIEAEHQAIVFRGLFGGDADRCLGCRAWLDRGSRSDPVGDRPQFPNHHAEAEQNESGAASDGAREDQGIAETEFLDRNPESDRCKARQHKTNAGDQQENHHRTHPRTALDSTRTAKATITSYCVHRQPPIAGQVPRKPGPGLTGRSLTACRDCCAATGKLRHNCPLPGHRTALYGRRGMRPKSAKTGPKGRRVTNSHVISDDVDRRYAPRGARWSGSATTSRSSRWWRWA